MDLKAEDFFNALCQDMTERGTTSRELVGLEFDPESGEISVFGGAAVHAADYPALETILKRSGKSVWPMESACANFDELPFWRPR